MRLLVTLWAVIVTLPRLAIAVENFEVVQRFPSGIITLTVGSDGNIYGVSTKGGVEKTAFRIDGTGTLTTIHTFANFGWVAYPPPYSRLVVGKDGALYGTTPNYTSFGPARGEFFRLDNAGNYTLLATLPLFANSDLILGQDGAFYGVLSVDSCIFGGCFGGNIFRIDTAGNLTLLTPNDPWEPPMPSVIGSDGALYGTKWVEDTAHIFRVDTISGNYTVLHEFEFATDGFYFAKDFILGSDGLIYGASNEATGGATGHVFRFDNLGNFTILHTFTGPDGALPLSPLTVGSDGAVYGIAEQEGPAWGGTLFKVDQAGAFSTLHAFDSVGAYPNQPLTRVKSGALYSTTASNYVFHRDTAGTFTSNPFNTTESLLRPVSPLVESGTDCALYGVVSQVGQGYDIDQTLYRLFEPGQLCQRITFAPLPDRKFGQPPFTVNATASSGLPVSYAAAGSCTVSGNLVTMTNVGMCTITASQPGDARFGAATNVARQFRVRSPGGCSVTTPDATSWIEPMALFLLCGLMMNRKTRRKNSPA